MSIAVKIKQLRIKHNKSLQDVADEVGASKAHIWDLETGKSLNPGIELLKKLAHCFQVSVADLIGENPTDESDPKIIAMYRDLKTLSPGDQETIRILMDRLNIPREENK